MPEDRTHPTLGDLLREARQRAGLTQLELARRAAVSVRSLRDIEQGRVEHPRQPAVHRLATALGLSAADHAAVLAAQRQRSARPRADRIWIGVLGPLVVRRGDGPVEITSSMQGALLGLLAVQPHQVVPTAEIVDVLWGEHPPQSCLRLVHTYVGQVRLLLEPGRPAREPARVLRRVRTGYRLDLDDDQLDVTVFDDLVGRSGRLRAAGDPGAAWELLDRALAGWRGPVLAGAGPRLRQHPAAVALASRRVVAVLAHADLALRLGRHAVAVGVLRGLLRDEPLHEGLAARLIRALAAGGEQAQALALYGQFRARLADDLGIEPGPELRQAHLDVLRGQAGTAPEPAPAPAAPSQLPADVAGFTGRAVLLRRLDALLPPAGDPMATAVVVSTIAGTAGVGKTALAVHWAHRVADRFPDGQLYVNLRGFAPVDSMLDPADAILGLLETLGVPPARIPTRPPDQAALYRSLLAGRRMLLVLDNARDAEQVRPLIPGAPGCLVVVTSRNQLSSLVAVEGAHPLTLDPLTHTEARQFLAHRLGRERVDAEPLAVDKIIAGCARLPLALAVLAARAAINPGFPLAALAADLQATPGGLDALQGDDAATDVRSVFSASYRTLGPAAARLFRLLGLHPGPDVTPPAAASMVGIPVRTARRLLAELASANLVAEHTAGRYAPHDLLNAYAAELAQTHETAADQRACTRRLLDHYLYGADAADRVLFPHRERIVLDEPDPAAVRTEFGGHEEAAAWFVAEQPVLLAAVRLAGGAGFERHAGQLAWILVDFLERRGRWREHAVVQSTALDAARRLGDLAGQAHAHRRLGHAMARLSRVADARRHLHQASELYAATGDHCGAAYAQLSLGWLAGDQGDIDGALRHTEQSLDLFLRAADRVGQARALNNLGSYHADRDAYGEALTCCRRAVVLLRASGDRLGEAHAWDSLGSVHHQLGRHRQAATCYRRAVELRRGTEDRYFEANALRHLGDTQQAAGDLAAARLSWQAALDILDELGHPAAAQVRAKLNAPAELDPARP